MSDPYEQFSPSSAKIEIVPAILSKKLRTIEQQLALVHSEARQVQIDVVDGVFARPKTWPYTDSATFDALVKGDAKLPFWDELQFELDLMVADPSADVREFIQTGVSRIVLHAHSGNVEQAFQRLIDTRNDEGSGTVSVGIAIMPMDQLEVLEPFDAQFDFVQVMGIDTIGRQGQKFNQHAVFLLERLRRRYPQLPLQVDGGVSLENAQALVRAGATRLIVGSAIFGSKDPIVAYRALMEIVNQS